MEENGIRNERTEQVAERLVVQNVVREQRLVEKAVIAVVVVVLVGVK